MTLEQFLLQIGINITSSFIYEKVRDYFTKESNPTIEGLTKELTCYLNIENADIQAKKIIQFLAEHGDINIVRSKIYASESIMMASSKSTKFTFGNDSSSRTDKSSIEAGRGAQIIGHGGARIEQDKEGNINFFV